MAERNACIRTCLEEFPYTPYELEMHRLREAWRLATQEATAASNAAAARATAGPHQGVEKIVNQERLVVALLVVKIRLHIHFKYARFKTRFNMPEPKHA